MSADITPGEDAADCCATARACLTYADQKPDQVRRWLRQAVDWAARGLVRAHQIPDDVLERTEREEEARTVLLLAAGRLAQELSLPPLTPQHQELRMTTDQPISTPAPSIAQVIAFIVDHATLADLEQLGSACNTREAALRAQRAATIEAG